jgi:hypothetical protein
MTNATNFEGFFACVLIFICTCVHLRRVKSLKQIINSYFKQFGPLSIFHKSSVLGIRLQIPIAIICITLSIYIIIR